MDGVVDAGLKLNRIVPRPFALLSQGAESAEDDPRYARPISLIVGRVMVEVRDLPVGGERVVCIRGGSLGESQSEDGLF